MEGAIKMARKYQSASGQPERYRIITFEGAFHGRTLATLAAGGQKKYLEGFGPVVDGFDQVPFADLEAVKAAIGPATAAILIEPIQGEGGVRAVPPAIPAGAAHSSATSTGCCWSSTRCRPASAAPARCSPMKQPASTPDIMATGQGAGRRLSARRLSSPPPEAAKGMTRRHPRLDLRRQSARDGGRQCGARRRARARLPRPRAAGRRSCSSSGSPRSRTCIPQIIAEVRGEGLLIGLRALVPNGELVDALRAEKMLTVAAGDNVVRLLPPLIVAEAEIADAMATARPRLHDACPHARDRRSRERRWREAASAISSSSSTSRGRTCAG